MVIGRMTDALRQARPTLRAMSRSGTVLSPVLVGRDGHLELAETRLSDAVAGHGRTLLIAGEPGIGKTRFLGAILRSVRARGIDSAKGDVGPQDRDVPGALILDLARTMFEVPLIADAGRTILERWAASTGAGGAARRRLVLDTVEDLRNVSDGHPLVYAFEDVQWADDLSLEAIAELARRIESRPILVLAVHRRHDTSEDAPLREWRSRLLTQRLAEEVRLDRLTRAQTATVVSLLMDSPLPAPREVVDAVYERSDGVPLHIEELLAAVRSRGPLDADAIRHVDVPDTIEDAVLARSARLSPEAQAVARAGAVLGRCFVPEVLAGVMDVPTSDLADPLEELVQQAILSPFGAKDVGYHDFRHQLLREALYAHTPVRERRRYHARAAEFGAQLVGATEVHRSLHLEQAGLRDEAYRAAMAGAEAAVRVSAHREAYELYRRALENRPADLDAASRAALHTALALEALALEESDVVVENAWAAAGAYREAGDTLRAIDATTLVLVIGRRNGDPIDERVDLARRMLAEAEALDDGEADWLRGDLLYYLAHSLVDAYEFAEARTALDAVRMIAARVDSQDLRLGADEVEAMIDFVEVSPEQGLAAMVAAAEAATIDRNETSTLSGYRDASILAARALDYPAARRFIEAGVRYGAEVEQSHCAHVMNGVATLISWADGAWDDATDLARHVVADRGCVRGASTARWTLGYVALGRGDDASARAELEPALAWARRGGAFDLILPALWGLAEADIHAGRAAEAAARCEEAYERARTVGDRALLVPFVVTGVRAYQAAGQPADAERWSAAVGAFLGDDLAFARPALDHGAGLVALAAGSTGAARRALEAAVAGWDARGRVWEASWARLDLAATLTRTNRHATAVALAGQVRETAERLGSTPLAERADELLRHGRGRIVELEPWHPLTAREFEVARLIADGHTNAEIADALGIAPKTASAHVEHILAKLGASRRAEIARWAGGVDLGKVSVA
jgi:DNA-binding CsgD family transcriptional regulator